MARQKVFIVVKTYPAISKKYGVLVCTAGILEDGSWIRLYPVPFRKLEDYQQFNKYSWIELDVERNPSDFRIESYRPTSLETLTITTEEKTKTVDWQKRKDLIFANTKIFKNMDEITTLAKTEKMSLAIFKPTKINKLTIKKTTDEWDAKKLKALEIKSWQLTFFQTPEETEKEFKPPIKIPYKFIYEFEDDAGKTSKMNIEDWEIGALYLNCLYRANGNEQIALEKVKEMYWDKFMKKDLYFFLGTTLEYHDKAPNPFTIIGVFYPPYPPKYEQLKLF
jgi:hypothetical protein